MKKLCCFLVLLISFTNTLTAQVRTPAQQLILTNEDSLNAGISKAKTVLSGYGSAFYQRNTNQQTASVRLERAILFVGHQFNSKISFFSEMEVENAKVDGKGGEIAMEQAFLKFNLSSTRYITAGLFIPRIGILNENHLPVNFNGTERPIVEQLIIPATWRELGVGFYGRSKKLPLNYSIAILNGLNSAAFEHGSGIREGRFEGRNATANNLAITGAIQYYYKDFTFQVSGYAGGSNGLSKRSSDSLQLSSGIFGMPVYLGEANVRWSYNGWNAKALGAYISFPQATNINKGFANNISSSMYGAYAEIAYNFFEKSTKMVSQQLNGFIRFETLDLNATIPSNAIYDGTQKQQHIIIGLAYLPVPNVVIKTDIRLLNTGAENPALVINPSPVRLPYQQNNSFINLGIGYSF
jgi:hypothetical protein